MKSILSIVIVNYNTSELIRDCLNSLFASAKRELLSGKYEVIVVDNASHDDSKAVISASFSWVKLIKNTENIGFARANNQAIAKTKGEYVLLLNPDTIVYHGTLKRMLRFMSVHSDVGISTCQVLLPSGKIDDASHRGFPTPWRALTYFTGLSRLIPFSIFFNGYHLGFRNLERVHEIDACVGAFLLIRREAGEKVNWLDNDYFWYGDDLDLCFRVKKIGFKIMYVPDVSIMHYKGAASGIKKHSQSVSKADMYTKQIATKARFEVMRIFYKKHYVNEYPRWVTKVVIWGINIFENLAKMSLR